MVSVKNAVLDEIAGMLVDFQDLYITVATQAIDHIHTKYEDSCALRLSLLQISEVIMTFGCSRTVSHFLKEAGRKRSFQLIVAESSPSFNGREMAEKMATTGMQLLVTS